MSDNQLLGLCFHRLGLGCLVFVVLDFWSWMLGLGCLDVVFFSPGQISKASVKVKVDMGIIYVNSKNLS